MTGSSIRPASNSRLLLAGLGPRTVRRAVVAVARWIVLQGRKNLLYPHVTFGARTSVDGRCRFGSGVTVGPDSTLMASSMGRQTYCAFRLWAANTSFGPFCAIGPGVISGIGRHPTRGFATSHPAFFSPSWPADRRYAIHPFEEHLPVEIGADVWVGANAFISAGVKVGHGAVIGAGAVVVRDVAPYEIVAGVPARRLRFRFPDEDIKFLLDLRWWEWPDDRLKAQGSAFGDLATLRKLVEAPTHGNPAAPGPSRGSRA